MVSAAIGSLSNVIQALVRGEERGVVLIVVVVV